MNQGWIKRAAQRFSGRGIPLLSKVYVEPTSRCNLSCTTCMRQTWDEPLGDMSMETFQSLISGLQTAMGMKAMAFWGIGEPLLHPHLAKMIAQAHGRGYATELITNGMLLTARVSRDLIAAGLDFLVASVDGSTAQSYTDIRKGADFDVLVRHLRLLNQEKARARTRFPEIGLEFVASRQNIHALPGVVEMARGLQATTLIVTNVVPYTSSFRDGVLYWLSAGEARRPATLSVKGLKVIVPNMDPRPGYQDVLEKLGAAPAPGLHQASGQAAQCPFITKNAMAVRWDGTVSPCVALMHGHTGFYLNRAKTVLHYGVGNVAATSAAAIWDSASYRAFRDRVARFDFPPCSHCDCDLACSNEEDCCGTPFPTCGDCLWAQGIAVCP